MPNRPVPRFAIVARRTTMAALLSLGITACADDAAPATAPPTEELAPQPTPATTSTVPATSAAQPDEAAVSAGEAAPKSTDRPATSAAPDTPICGADDRLPPQPDRPVPVILDTDFASDVDDVGALAVLHALADAGDVEIIAVMVSDGSDAPAHRAIDAVNTFYGRPDIPIGVVSGVAPAFPSTYVDELATLFPNDVEDPPSAVDLYRRILAEEPDDSVTIVSVGYLTNLDALLSSPPDAQDAMSGLQLVDTKVRRLVVMGGYYPDSIDHPFGAEFNFEQDVTAALNIVDEWPTPIVFSGYEIGDIVLTGAVLREETPAENPVRVAYELFNGGNDHKSWDLTAVLTAARGTAGVFEVCVGRNVIGLGGENRWINDESGPHGYLRLVTEAQDVAAELDLLLTVPPAGS